MTKKEIADDIEGKGEKEVIIKEKEGDEIENKIISKNKVIVIREREDWYIVKIVFKNVMVSHSHLPPQVYLLK